MIDGCKRRCFDCHSGALFHPGRRRPSEDGAYEEGDAVAGALGAASADREAFEQRTPETAQKWVINPQHLWTTEPQIDYGGRAQAAGSNLIRYESVRVPGANNHVVVNDFNEILRPQEILERP